MDLTVKTEPQGNRAWFHQEFMSGEHEGCEYALSSTAGCGGNVLILRVSNKETGESVREVINVETLFREWLGEKMKEVI